MHRKLRTAGMAQRDLAVLVEEVRVGESVAKVTLGVVDFLRLQQIGRLLTESEFMSLSAVNVVLASENDLRLAAFNAVASSAVSIEVPADEARVSLVTALGAGHTAENS